MGRLLETFLQWTELGQNPHLFPPGWPFTITNLSATEEECEDTDRKEIIREYIQDRMFLGTGSRKAVTWRRLWRVGGCCTFGLWSSASKYPLPGFSAFDSWGHHHIWPFPTSPYREHKCFPLFLLNIIKTGQYFQRGFIDTLKITNRKYQQHWKPSNLLRVTSRSQEPQEQV